MVFAVNQEELRTKLIDVYECYLSSDEKTRNLGIEKAKDLDGLWSGSFLLHRAIERGIGALTGLYVEPLVTKEKAQEILLALKTAHITAIYNITATQHYDDVHRYVIQKEENIHRAFCNLLSEMGFDEEAVLQIDVLFDDLDEEFFYVSNKESEVYLFVTSKNVHLVFKTPLAQVELHEVLEKHFRFLE